MSNRCIKVSFDVPDAWETWYIEVTTDDAPDEITEDWLLENCESWEWLDMRDSGGFQRANFIVEDQGV